MTMNATPAAKAGAKTLLIADDEPNIRRVLQAIFQKDGYVVHVAENGVRALEVAAAQPIDVLITDLIMPDMNGVELLQKIKQRQGHVVAIMITAYATIKTCVDAMRYGASDYITKPFDMDEIRAVVKRAVSRAAEADQASISGTRKGGATAAAAIAAPESTAMRQVQEMVTRAAASKATVLIRGESGTGKELIARALHEQSQRGKDGKPFIAVSCAALAETLLDSELFGHEKNAFTGAATEKKGRFELAHGGTLFLDEIGDIAPSVQIKLLRVLQQREFERVGGTKTISVDVRLVAATNAP
jgi:two-component system response regulator AtoC